MERQYIFFRSGKALLVFSTGIVGLVACTLAIDFLAPGESWLLFFVVAGLAILLILFSFRFDAVWRGR